MYLQYHIIQVFSIDFINFDYNNVLITLEFHEIINSYISF